MGHPVREGIGPRPGIQRSRVSRLRGRRPPWGAHPAPLPRGHRPLQLLICQQGCSREQLLIKTRPDQTLARRRALGHCLHCAPQHGPPLRSGRASVSLRFLHSRLLPASPQIPAAQSRGEGRARQCLAPQVRPVWVCLTGSQTLSTGAWILSTGHGATPAESTGY